MSGSPWPPFFGTVSGVGHALRPPEEPCHAPHAASIKCALPEWGDHVFLMVCCSSLENCLLPLAYQIPTGPPVCTFLLCLLCACGLFLPPLSCFTGAILEFSTSSVSSRCPARTPPPPSPEIARRSRGLPWTALQGKEPCSRIRPAPPRLDSGFRCGAPRPGVPRRRLLRSASSLADDPPPPPPPPPPPVVDPNTTEAAKAGLK